MDGDASKGHNSLQPGLQINVPVNIQVSQAQNSNMLNHGCWKMTETDVHDIISNIQDLLDQLSSRGVQSMLVTIGHLGDIGIRGSQRGQIFLKENSDVIDRFAKICTDDVWTLLGAQKRFFEMGRTNQNKTVTFNDKGDYPLDFSHERGNYFPAQNGANDRVNAQDNSFVQGILSQGVNQNKGYQPANSFLSNNGFSQYMNDGRSNYHTGTFFQGGFTQGLPGSETYPQPAFMAGLDVAPHKDNFGNMVNTMLPGSVPVVTSALSPDVGHDRQNGITPSEAELIKEMLNSAPVQDVINATASKSNKDKSQKLKDENSEKAKEAALKKRRERRPETWQRNIKKKLKTEGKAYVNAKGKFVPAKSMRSVDCSKCKQKCTDKISEETRKKIFEWFWKLGSYTAQKEFVVSRVTQVATKTSKRRHVHRLFSFEINGKYESVCKPFFSKTLGIGDSYIYKAFEQKARDLFVQDGRGKHAPVNKTSERQVEHVHEHLDRFLTEYPYDKPLPKNIHAVKWYEEYLTSCGNDNQKPVSKHIYRKIFQEYVRRYPENPKSKKQDQSSSSGNQISDMSEDSS